MNYARRSDKVFSSKNTIVTKKAMSPEAASRKQYIASHTFSVHVNSSTHEASVKVECKRGK